MTELDPVTERACDDAIEETETILGRILLPSEEQAFTIGFTCGAIWQVASTLERLKELGK